MATYSTDLTTLTTAESGTWTEFASPYNGAGTPALDGENYIQGVDCFSQTTGKAVGLEISIVYDSGANQTIPSGEAVFAWCFYAVGVNLETYANGGWRFGIGSSTSAWDSFYISGSDRGRNPYGGWINVAIDPNITSTAVVGGGNGGNFRYFGSVPNTLAEISKGTPSAMDAIRIGRGQLSITGTGGSFAELAQYNDYNAGGTPPGTGSTSIDTGRHRLGLFQEAAGTYLWKGLLSFGLAGTTVTFSDSNETIIVDNVKFATSSFNKIEINNSGSSVTWNAITFISTADAVDGTVAHGDFEMIANATVSLDSCSFTNMGLFVFQSNATITGSAFRQCNTITQGGATFDSCTFSNSRAASSILVNNYSLLTGTQTFVSDGSNHAIELTGSTVPTSITWNHIATGYAAGTLGAPITPTASTNATIYINPTSAVSTNITITVPTGVTTPSVRVGANYTGSVTVQAQQKTIDVNVKDENGSPISGAQVWINDGVITIFNGTTDVNGDIPQQNYGGTNNSTLRVRKYGYQPFETTLGTATGNVSQLVTALTDDQQQDTPPTPVSTWTINTTLSTITMTSGATLPHNSYATMDTVKTLYQYVMNIFAGSSFMQFEVPFESITATQYAFINGWTFGAKDNDYKFLYNGSIVDTTNVLQWSNIRTIGSLETGTNIYIVQGVEASDAALTSWWPAGNLNVLVKTRDTTWLQSTDDTATNINGGLWLFAREYGNLYDHFFVDAAPQGQNIVALSTLPDLNNQTASGTVATYTDITVTIGATSQDIGDGNGNQPYNALVNCNGRPLSEVYEYLKYITRRGADSTALLGTTDNGYEYRNANEASFSNVDNKQAPFGSFAGGRFFGAYGVFLFNMASSDNTNYELTDSNGVLRFPPSTVSFSLTGLKDGTEIRIYDTLDNAIAGVEDMTGGVGTFTTTGVTVTGTTDNNTFNYTYTYSSNIDIYVVVLSLNYQILRLSGLTLTNTSQSIPVSQVFDRNYFDPA